MGDESKIRPANVPLPVVVKRPAVWLPATSTKLCPSGPDNAAMVSWLPFKSNLALPSRDTLELFGINSLLASSSVAPDLMLISPTLQAASNMVELLPSKFTEPPPEIAPFKRNSPPKERIVADAGTTISPIHVWVLDKSWLLLANTGPNDW